MSTTSSGVCQRAASSLALTDGVGALLLVGVAVSAGGALAIAIWQRRHARTVLSTTDDNERGALVLLPMYQPILAMFVIADLYSAVYQLLISYHTHIPAGSLNPSGSLLWGTLMALEIALYALLNEGLALLLLQQSAGTRTIRRVAIAAITWAIFCFLAITMATVAERSGRSHIVALLVVAQQSCLTLFYLIMWLSPMVFILRRPALIPYSRALTLFCMCKLATAVSAYIGDDIHYCVDMGKSWLIGILYPYLIFRTLAADSNYWSGAFHEPGATYRMSSFSKSQSGSGAKILGIRDPLLGSALTHRTASSLAESVESLQARKVPLINFALLSIGEEGSNNLLGQGAAARVYRGSYKGRPVAVKLIFMIELAPKDVASFIEEASHLHSLRNHPNVVKLFGVCIRPPGLALVMELCPFGSLYDVIHAPSPHQTASKPTKKERTISATNANANAAARITATNTSTNSSGTSTPVLSQSHGEDSKYSMTPSAAAAMATPTGVTAATSSSGASVSIAMEREHIGNDDIDDGDRETPSYIPMTIRHKLMLAWQCCKGVAALHALSPPLLHLDLKSSNFLVGTSSKGGLTLYECKVADLELSTTTGEAHNRFGDTDLSGQEVSRPLRLPDTFNWSAPEVLAASSLEDKGRALTTKTDCFALGMVLFEIASGEIPYDRTRKGVRARPTMQRSDTLRDIADGTYRPQIPLDCEPRFAKLIQNLWSSRPDDRPSAQTAADRLEQILVSLGHIHTIGHTTLASNNINNSNSNNGDESKAVELPAMATATVPMVGDVSLIDLGGSVAIAAGGNAETKATELEPITTMSPSSSVHTISSPHQRPSPSPASVSSSSSRQQSLQPSRGKLAPRVAASGGVPFTTVTNTSSASSSSPVRRSAAPPSDRAVFATSSNNNRVGGGVGSVGARPLPQARRPPNAR